MILFLLEIDVKLSIEEIKELDENCILLNQLYLHEVPNSLGRKPGDSFLQKLD